MSKKTFNAVATALIRQLLYLFEGDKTLMFMLSEMERCRADKKLSHVPGANFFNTMNLETQIPPALPPGERAMGQKVSVGELVIRKDERVFGPETGVTVPALEAMGMRDKWPKLSPANKEMVWNYLLRMAQTSAEIVLLTKMTDPDVVRAMQQLSAEDINHLTAGATEAQLNDIAGRIQEIIAKTPE